MRHNISSIRQVTLQCEGRMHFLNSSLISWENNLCNAHLECIYTRVHVSIIYLESRHRTFFFHAYDLVLSTGPLKLPGCLSSAWPLKRRLRLRLRRWGFFFTIICNCKVHHETILTKTMQKKKQRKTKNFLPSKI